MESDSCTPNQLFDMSHMIPIPIHSCLQPQRREEGSSNHPAINGIEI
jgi:hypothetical protein